MSTIPSKPDLDFVMLAERMNPDRVEQFWANVAPATSGCWLWTAGKFTAGYGGFIIDGKTRYAHRIAYELVKGPIPKGAYLLHSCDTPACCNPDHLTAGTQEANIQDAARKGRWMSAKRIAHLGKLHEKQVKHGYCRRDPSKRTPKPTAHLSLPLGWEDASCAQIGATARQIAVETPSGKRTKLRGIFYLSEDGRWRGEKPTGVVEGNVIGYRPIV